MEFAIGKKTNTLTVEGTWDLAFNPFCNGIKTGTRQTVVTFKITNAVVATANYAIVVNWHITDTADDVCRYSLTLSGDWVYNDFCNTAA